MQYLLTFYTKMISIYGWAGPVRNIDTMKLSIIMLDYIVKNK